MDRVVYTDLDQRLLLQQHRKCQNLAKQTFHQNDAAVPALTTMGEYAGFSSSPCPPACNVTGKKSSLI